MFSGILISRDEAGQSVAVASLDEAQLPEGDVSIDVEYSTLNYKDGLAITGSSPVVRKFPMVPGIDLAGVVRESSHADWKAGDRVILNGWGVGETHSGGLAQRARVKADWLLHLPPPLSERQAMAIGTAGYTAMLCVMALQRHGLSPGDGDVLVTGASGGVGTVAISLLAGLGYRVVASTGRLTEAGFLQGLGAAEVISREEFSHPGKPLAKERFAGVVDAVGSHTLANACAATRFNGAVTACGLAQGGDFPTTVMPFILRGVTLYGINSVFVPNALRAEAWALMAQHLSVAQLDALSNEIGLSEAIAYAPKLLAGEVRGRTVVNTAT